MAVKTAKIKLKQDSYVKVTDYLGKKQHLVERTLFDSFWKIRSVLG